MPIIIQETRPKDVDYLKQVRKINPKDYTDFLLLLESYHIYLL
jgi:hypothetical protein